MCTTTINSRDFCRQIDAAKAAAQHGPVFVTEQGRPKYVLLGIEDYRRLAGTRRDLAAALAMTESPDLVFDLGSIRKHD